MVVVDTKKDTFAVNDFVSYSKVCSEKLSSGSISGMLLSLALDEYVVSRNNQSSTYFLNSTCFRRNQECISFMNVIRLSPLIYPQN